MDNVDGVNLFVANMEVVAMKRITAILSMLSLFAMPAPLTVDSSRLTVDSPRFTVDRPIHGMDVPQFQPKADPPSAETVPLSDEIIASAQTAREMLRCD